MRDTAVIRQMTKSELSDGPTDPAHGPLPRIQSARVRLIDFLNSTGHGRQLRFFVCGRLQSVLEALHGPRS